MTKAAVTIRIEARIAALADFMIFASFFKGRLEPSAAS
jgi:hypothetical protein